MDKRMLESLIKSILSGHGVSTEEIDLMHTYIEEYKTNDAVRYVYEIADKHPGDIVHIPFYANGEIKSLAVAKRVYNES